MAILLPKAQAASQCKDFRPITLVPVLVKLYCRILLNKTCDVLTQGQSDNGFRCRKGYTAMDMVQTIRQVVEKSIEWSHPVVILKPDFKKAYDSVKRTAIAHALGSLDSKSLQAAFLRAIVDQNISSVLEDVSSDPVHMTRGLLQGDPRSPAVFSACIDNLVSKLRAWWEKSDKFCGINVDGYTLNALRWLGDIFGCARHCHSSGDAERHSHDVTRVMRVATTSCEMPLVLDTVESRRP